MSNDRRADIFLVTVDCWRHDAIEDMTRFDTALAQSDGFRRAEAITHAAATEWSFPQLLAGQYFPNLVEGVNYTNLVDTARPLPQLLAENGYQTGAFVGSNPNVNIWEPYFDTWMNANLEIRTFNRSEFSKASSLLHFLLQRDKVPANRIISNARDWISATEPPRFVWLHFMEPHAPYFGGLSGAWSNGLRNAYSITWHQMRGDKRAKVESEGYDEFLVDLERLYRSTLKRLDRPMTELFNSLPEDAISVFVGDHGEEFAEDWYGHSRPYDDCVRVPLVTNLPIPNGETIRQLEIPNRIIDHVGIDQPPSWRRALEFEEDTSFIIHPSIHNYRRLFVGCRTEEYKYLRIHHPESAELMSEELYNLGRDPEESNDIAEDEPETVDSLRRRVDEFLTFFDIDLTDFCDSDRARELSPDVDQRLQELGYVG